MGTLARSDISVTKVSDSTGYASPSHFVASFRQRLGITPGTYRGALSTQRFSAASEATRQRDNDVRDG